MPWTSWLLLFTILFFAGLRFRLRSMPLERDEGEYAYAGQLMLQGIPPYHLAYNMKLPGTYAAYAVIMAIFGQDSAGIHEGLIIVNAVTTLLVVFVTRKLYGTEAAVFAGVSYAVLSASPAVLGLAGHATHFVTLAAMAGILLLLYALEPERKLLLFVSGSCLGIAFLMKQPGIVFALFAIFHFLFHRRRNLAAVGTLLSATALIAGIAWPFVLTCGLMDWAGVFPNFWFWTFSYASQYASRTPLQVGMLEFWNASRDLISRGGAIWFIAACGLVVLLRNAKGKTHAVFVLALLLFSFVGTSAGILYRGHYFILMLPAVSLLSGLAVSSANEALRERYGQTPTSWIAIIVFGAACVLSIFQGRGLFFAPDATIACRRMYQDNPFPEAQQIGEYLKASASPEARIAVFGSEPEIYFYAQRHSATGYIYSYSLMEDQAYASRMQQQMIEEVTQTQPEFVVFVDNQLSWLWQFDASREGFFKWLQMYINTGYVKAAQIDIQGNAQHLLDDVPRIYIYKRASTQP